MTLLIQEEDIHIRRYPIKCPLFCLRYSNILPPTPCSMRQGSRTNFPNTVVCTAADSSNSLQSVYMKVSRLSASIPSATNVSVETSLVDMTSWFGLVAMQCSLVIECNGSMRCYFSPSLYLSILLAECRTIYECQIDHSIRPRGHIKRHNCPVLSSIETVLLSIIDIFHTEDLSPLIRSTSHQSKPHPALHHAASSSCSALHEHCSNHGTLRRCTRYSSRHNTTRRLRDRGGPPTASIAETRSTTLRQEMGDSRRSRPTAKCH